MWPVLREELYKLDGIVWMVGLFITVLEKLPEGYLFVIINAF